MFKWLDKLFSTKTVKETQAPPFRNPTHPSKKKPRIGKDAQNVVLWLEKNTFFHSNVENWVEWVDFWNDGLSFCIEKESDRAKLHRTDRTYGQTTLHYTDDETSWILYNAKRIQDGREKQREKELKGQFK